MAEWNDEVVEILQREGAAAEPRYKYHGAHSATYPCLPQLTSASKVYSERAFWDYFKQPRAADGVALQLSLVRPTPLPFPSHTSLVHVGG